MNDYQYLFMLFCIFAIGFAAGRTRKGNRELSASEWARRYQRKAVAKEKENLRVEPMAVDEGFNVPYRPTPHAKDEKNR